MANQEKTPEEKYADILGAYSKGSKASDKKLTAIGQSMFRNLINLSEEKKGEVVVKGTTSAKNLVKAIVEPFFKLYFELDDKKYDALKGTLGMKQLYEIASGYMLDSIKEIAKNLTDYKQLAGLVVNTVNGMPDKQKPSRLYNLVNAPADDKFDSGLDGLLAKA